MENQREKDIKRIAELEAKIKENKIAERKKDIKRIAELEIKIENCKTTEKKQNTSNTSGATKLIKFILVIILFFCFTINYKYISFNGGFKTVLSTFTYKQPNQTNDIVNNINFIADIENIYYYKTAFNKNKYNLIIETENNGLLLQKTSYEDLLILKLSGELLNNIKPKAVTIIPWWLYLIGLIVIIVFPTKRKITKN